MCVCDVCVNSKISTQRVQNRKSRSECVFRAWFIHWTAYREANGTKLIVLFSEPGDVVFDPIKLGVNGRLSLCAQTT